MGKYQHLSDYLTEQKGDCCTLPFIKIEEIIGSSLPLRDTDGNYLAVCRAPEAAENGLRLDALGNLI